LEDLRDTTLNKLALLDFASALRWATANADPRRFAFLADLLLPSSRISSFSFLI
jgi:hypothetical protein